MRRIDVPQPTRAWAVLPFAIGRIAVLWVIQRIVALTIPLSLAKPG